MLWILPLEPLPERYTEQWSRWFMETCTKRKLEFKLIYGITVGRFIGTGRVLDAAGTTYWKANQLHKVADLFLNNEVKNGDRFFTMDMFHPGLEAIPYMAQVYGLDVKIYSFLHAGSYTKEDFAEPMSRWAHYFERGWAYICEKIFVGSSYHQMEFCANRSVDSGKVISTGNPFSSTEILRRIYDYVPVEKRDNIIIFPHRWDMEKHPEIFISIVNTLYEQRQDFQVIISTGRVRFRDPEKHLAKVKFLYTIYEGLTKISYYNLLATAKVFVSTAVDEHFGYCAAESCTAGCSIVVPNRWSYPELFNHDMRFLYPSEEEAVNMISKFLDNPVSVPEYMEKYNGSVDMILDEILK